MALMPKDLIQLLDFEEVACLLAGLEPEQAPSKSLSEAKRMRLLEWRKTIAYAVFDGSLRATGRTAVVDPACPMKPLLPLTYADYNPHRHQLRARFLRADVLAWLKSAEISDDEIPVGLRNNLQPSTPSIQQDKPLHHKRKKSYLTLIEGLVLKTIGSEILEEPYKAAGVLLEILDGYGLKMDKDPVADTVKEILAAREERKSERS